MNSGNSMIITDLSIPDVKILHPKLFQDERGYFFEAYHESLFCSLIGNTHFVQDNESKSQRGTLRGLHYQIIQPQAKLLRVLDGEIFDVAVDLRKSSPTFGRYVCIVLRSKDHNQLFIPSGFAHGFLVISETAKILYKVSDYYCPAGERSILWNDDTLNISWPVEKGEKLIISSKDQNGYTFKNAEYFD